MATVVVVVHFDGFVRMKRDHLRQWRDIVFMLEGLRRQVAVLIQKLLRLLLWLMLLLL